MYYTVGNTSSGGCLRRVASMFWRARGENPCRVALCLAPLMINPRSLRKLTARPAWQCFRSAVLQASSFLPSFGQRLKQTTTASVLPRKVGPQRLALKFGARKSGGGSFRRRGGQRRSVGLPVGRAVFESWRREWGWRVRGEGGLCGGSGGWSVGRGNCDGDEHENGCHNDGPSLGV